MTKTSNGARHMVYALSLADGSIFPGWPLDMQGAAHRPGRELRFLRPWRAQRAAVLQEQALCELWRPFRRLRCLSRHGRADRSTRRQARGQLADPRHRRRHLAQGGIAGDGTFLFVTTGNTFGASSWKDGEAIIRLHPGLAHSDDTRDYFAPSNWKDLDNSDQDLGGTEALPIDIKTPGKSKRVIAFGKDGKAYLVNRGQSRRRSGAARSRRSRSPTARSARRPRFTRPGRARWSPSPIRAARIARAAT